MTDRELLERAALAADIEYDPDNAHAWPWNPLENDGDALRLAVKLNLLDEHPGFTHELAVQMGATDDPYVATRRAIVITAAALAQA